MAIKFDKILGTIRESDVGSGGASDINFDTEANILISTPVDSGLGFSTDTKKAFFWDGTSWYRHPFNLVIESPNPDMGATQGSSRIGYGDDYITDKDISNFKIGFNTIDEDRGIRAFLDPDLGVLRYQAYSNNTWNDILFNFVFTEDFEFEHLPLTELIDVWSGNSNLLGLNGLPIIQQYKVSMGAFPFPVVIDGGTF